MKAGSMEALIGASRNMKLVSTPMRVYKEAERKGDTATMERAMGYVTEHEQKAKDYSDRALEETERELKEERKEQEERLEKVRKERKEQAAKLEKGRKERKEQEARLEKGRKNHGEHEEKIEGTRKERKVQGIQHENEKAMEKRNPTQGTADIDYNHIVDTVDISKEGKAALEKHIALD